MKCSICGVPFEEADSRIGTGDGSMREGGSFAHPACYYRRASDQWELRARRAEMRVHELEKALRLLLDAGEESEWNRAIGRAKALLESPLSAG